MNYKQYGRDQRRWNPAARYSIHDNNGMLASFAGQSRLQAKRDALALGNGFWVKDNINTYFFYGVVNGKPKRIKIGSFAHTAYNRRYPATRIEE